jgi:hypothetical protein
MVYRSGEGSASKQKQFIPRDNWVDVREANPRLRLPEKKRMVHLAYSWLELSGTCRMLACNNSKSGYMAWHGMAWHGVLGVSTYVSFFNTGTFEV